MAYRVRRDIPGNTYTQLKSSTLKECKDALKSLKKKWDEVAKEGAFAEAEPYETKLAKKELVVSQGDRIVDRYVVEKV